MITKTSHGDLGDLPIPIRGHLTDSHMRAVMFYGANASECLHRAALYLAAHQLDSNIAAISYHHNDPELADPVQLMVILEASV